jgi:hypothetical protein
VLLASTRLVWACLSSLRPQRVPDSPRRCIGEGVITDAQKLKGPSYGQAFPTSAGRFCRANGHRARDCATRGPACPHCRFSAALCERGHVRSQPHGPHPGMESARRVIGLSGEGVPSRYSGAQPAHAAERAGGRELRGAPTSSWRDSGSVGVCGRNHDRLQLMRQPLAAHAANIG